MSLLGSEVRNSGVKGHEQFNFLIWKNRRLKTPGLCMKILNEIVSIEKLMGAWKSIGIP